MAAVAYETGKESKIKIENSMINRKPISADGASGFVRRLNLLISGQNVEGVQVNGLRRDKLVAAVQYCSGGYD